MGLLCCAPTPPPKTGSRGCLNLRGENRESGGIEEAMEGTLLESCPSFEREFVLWTDGLYSLSETESL